MQGKVKVSSKIDSGMSAVAPQEAETTEPTLEERAAAMMAAVGEPSKVAQMEAVAIAALTADLDKREAPERDYEARLRLQLEYLEVKRELPHAVLCAGDSEQAQERAQMKLQRLQELREALGIAEDKARAMDWQDPQTWPASMQERRRESLEHWARPPREGWLGESPHAMRVDTLSALAMRDPHVQEVCTYLDAMVWELIHRLPHDTLEGHLVSHAENLAFGLVQDVAEAALEWAARVQKAMPYDTAEDVLAVVVGELAEADEDNASED